MYNSASVIGEPESTPPAIRTLPSASVIAEANVLALGQLLLGQTKQDSTVRYVGIEVDDALKIAQET
jgi:hypothetical protein